MGNWGLQRSLYLLLVGCHEPRSPVTYNALLAALAGSAVWALSLHVIHRRLPEQGLSVAPAGQCAALLALARARRWSQAVSLLADSLAPGMPLSTKVVALDGVRAAVSAAGSHESQIQKALSKLAARCLANSGLESVTQGGDRCAWSTLVIAAEVPVQLRQRRMEPLQHRLEMQRHADAYDRLLCCVDGFGGDMTRISLVRLGAAGVALV
ncbi:hypothetical protein AK812_SmicGene36025 [Symbiodinium microadriaticum]|uniref:Pentatricopeptide repeat-containing protein, chloroplastic n=1 Tax=Symbiodinium microadriaticum TaxID=2951 RepID=A0A1Q9CJW7_SYMMI|nr:hypothetical protein AK812_SmicGene36025 [Symbiodinium microadriaticum]